MSKDKLMYVAVSGGIKLESKGDVWINPSKTAKADILKNLSQIKGWVGKDVIVEMVDDNTFSGIAPISNPDGESGLSKSHIVNISGKEFVTMAGLLDVAHKNALEGISTEEVKIDFDNNIFVFKAKVTMKGGRVFESFGDATKDNVGSLVSSHILRMAETRAISRALRWATNVGMTSLEEMGEKDKDVVRTKPTDEDVGITEDV